MKYVVLIVLMMVATHATAQDGNITSMPKLQVAMCVVTHVNAAFQAGFAKLEDGNDMKEAEQEVIRVFRDYVNFTADERFKTADAAVVSSSAGIVLLGALVSSWNSDLEKMARKQFVSYAKLFMTEEFRVQESLARLLSSRFRGKNFFRSMLDREQPEWKIRPILNSLEQIQEVKGDAQYFSSELSTAVETSHKYVAYLKTETNVEASFKTYNNVAEKAKILQTFVDNPNNLKKIERGIRQAYSLEHLEMVENSLTIAEGLAGPYFSKANVIKLSGEALWKGGVVIGAIYGLYRYFFNGGFYPGQNLTNEDLGNMNLSQLRYYLFRHPDQTDLILQNADQVGCAL